VTHRERNLVTDIASMVGGYLTNTRRGPGYCPVCSTPIEFGTLCRGCIHHRDVPTALLADQVVSLAYGGHTPQSQTLLYGYKKEVLAIGVGQKQYTQEQILILYLIHVALDIHRSCIEKSFGPLTHYAVVPSTRGRADHPFPQLMELVCVEVQKLRHVAVGYVGPKSVPGQQETRKLNSDWYSISASANITGHHVLVIDDTWASGNRAQSVSWALKRAGASSVTVLTVARWLNSDWSANRDFFDSAIIQPPYNPQVCPLTGGSCPA